ncbi:hypothetical protein PMAYCL1PPCAC_21246, partial [Pristionchus mayeri]
SKRTPRHPRQDTMRRMGVIVIGLFCAVAARSLHHQSAVVGELDVGVCPPGYSYINGTDACFKLYTLAKAFPEAETTCKQDGGHLASIHSVEEKHGLNDLIGTDLPLIGIKCTTTTSCTWTDGTPYDYQNFIYGQPTLEYGSCAHLFEDDDWFYSWNCATPIGTFLCRLPVVVPPTTTRIPPTTPTTRPTTTTHSSTTTLPSTTPLLITTPRPATTVASNCPNISAYEGTHLTSPGWPVGYPRNANCWFYLTCAPGKRLLFEFEVIDTKRDKDYVSIRDGPYQNSTEFARVSGKTRENTLGYLATSNHMTLQFISDSDEGGQGWTANVDSQ